jgi:uncharacterized protein YsxB (DUF464 family)
MVLIETIRTDNRINSFTISGHADSGPYGHDIVCAGVSAVSFGSVNAIEALCGVRLGVETEDDGGFLRCIVPDNLETETDEKVQLLLESMVVSLKSIKEQYGQYIELKDVRR